MTALIDTYAMPPIALLKRYAGACRYLSDNPAKACTSGQVKTIHGLAEMLVLNFENEPNAALLGSSGGLADGTSARSAAQALGAPAGVAIYYSVDFEATQSQVPAIVAYFRAVAVAHRGSGYLIGAYGDAFVIANLLKAKVIDLGWQTSSHSGSTRDPAAVLYQDAFNAGYDVDVIEHPFIGAWLPSGAQPNPAEDVVTPQDKQDIIAGVVAGLSAKLAGGVNVVGLEDDAHTAAPTMEELLAGVPGYVSIETRHAAAKKGKPAP